MLRGGRRLVTSRRAVLTSWRRGALTSRGGPPLSPPMAALARALERARGEGRGGGPRPETPPGWERDFRDQFVPLSREGLQGLLLREFHSSPASRAAFLDFAARLDRALHPRYHRYHLHLQALYGPIDPDRDTGLPGEGEGGGPGGGGVPPVPGGGSVPPGGEGRRARRVVAALGPLLAEANFQRLPEAAIAFALLVQHPRDEVQVSVRLEEYEEIQFWARGECVGPLPHIDPPAPPRRWKYRRTPPAPHRRYFRRVVVVALPRGGPLELGSFRAVPLEALELLLGRGRVRTSGGARARLHLGLGVWGTLLFLNVGVGLMADLKVGASVLLLGIAAAVAFRGAKAVGRQRAAAALDLARSRYRRGTAQHGDLAAAITRRAQDEATKEALLAHTFLPRVQGSGGGPEGLQREVESWLRQRLGVPVSFPAQRALRRLHEIEGGPPQTHTPPRTPPPTGGGTDTPPPPTGGPQIHPPLGEEPKTL